MCENVVIYYVLVPHDADFPIYGVTIFSTPIVSNPMNRSSIDVVFMIASEPRATTVSQLVGIFHPVMTPRSPFHDPFLHFVRFPSHRLPFRAATPRLATTADDAAPWVVGLLVGLWCFGSVERASKLVTLHQFCVGSCSFL